MVTAIFVAPGANASQSSTDFESFTPGSPNGQQGWQLIDPQFDYAVVDNGATSPASFGARSLRMSNAVTETSYGSHVFSASLSDEAGTTDAASGAFSGGTRVRFFQARWDVASFVPDAEQPGLALDVSPDRGDGARMSLLRMRDTPSGIEISFIDYLTAGTACDDTNGWHTTVVASGLSRATPHTIELAMQFIDGRGNDIVNVAVDGTPRHTGTSWGDYFRSCQGPSSRTVDSLLFRAPGSSEVPANAGKGFLIDNVSINSAAVGSPQFSVPPESGSTVITVAGTAPPGAKVSVSDGSTLIGQTTADAQGRWTLGRISFAPGAHTLRAIADLNGTLSDAGTFGFTITDTTPPPAPAIADPIANASFAANTVTLDGAAEPTAVIRIFEGASLKNSITAATNGRWSVQAFFAEGVHDVVATATDAAGNVSAASPARRFSVDLSAPESAVISSPAPDAVIGPDLVGGGTAESRAFVAIDLSSDKGARWTGTVTADGQGRWSFGAKLGSGVWTLLTRARDAAGNASPQTDPLRFTVDATRPEVSGSSDGNLYLPISSPTVSGTATDATGVARVEIVYTEALTGRVFSRPAACTGCPGQSVTYSDRPSLDPGSYRADIYAVDVVGNRSLAAHASFTVI